MIVVIVVCCVLLCYMYCVLYNQSAAVICLSIDQRKHGNGAIIIWKKIRRAFVHACVSCILMFIANTTIPYFHVHNIQYAYNAQPTNHEQSGFDQVPQLTSSRLIDVRKPFKIINEQGYGTKRAVLIGINYTGQQGELSGCHNDVKNMKEYLVKIQGFEERNMTILMDDNYHTSPTRSNISQAYRDLVRSSVPGDTVFCHYSGHGGRVVDTSGDEDDGYDETLIPVDFKRAGQITDDELFAKLVKPLPKGVLMTSLMDCCHSGTVLDLPYRFTADGDAGLGMQRTPDFDFDHLIVGAVACCCVMELLDCLVSIIG